ncbi:hypothetical protein SCALIN_C22_0146 [Candidatus Scalindua japonica]|uniref:Lipocalin-like domain-containing protein n=1 Tax=Candidatus Scalindua japonica TaxID=1284222 RepID=A0A286TZW4_9BACT|nr:hypothetical protein [Candidatus Scalindua japonica]GAX61435.1 hypothetical protein SCALIN_C22_0146 [Candidatus Scalindua japonica]
MSYVGKWRITETSVWDTEYLDELEEASVEFTKESGTMTFGYIHIEMDVVKDEIGGIEILGYSFVEDDEDDEVSGWGWFRQTLTKDKMEGKIYFHYGESSQIRIARYKKGR